METNKTIWFKAKKWGWGWRPISWQGWGVTALYVLSLLRLALEAKKQHSVSDFLINFGLDFIVLTIPFLIICYLKGEKPRWSWGKDNSPPPQA